MAGYDYTWVARYATSDFVTYALESSGPRTGTLGDPRAGTGLGSVQPGPEPCGLLTDTAGPSVAPLGTGGLGDAGQGRFVGALDASDDAVLHVYGAPSDPAAFSAPATLTVPLGFGPSDRATGFAAGTLIGTPGGGRAVETLAVGDPVTTADGRTVPVRWVGRQTLHGVVTPADRFEPVRVAAGALGGGLPRTDLVLTADHALILGDLAIEAGALVNGTTIAFVGRGALPERVAYYGVETEAHEVILANGAPAESYIDYAGRRAFDDHAAYVALWGDEPVIAEMPRLRIASRRQLPGDLRARFGIGSFAEAVTAEAEAFLAARRA